MAEQRRALAQDRTEFAEDRTALAEERTYLSWVRTGLGALAVGAAFNRLIPLEPFWTTRAVGTALVAAAALCFVGSLLRLLRVTRRLDVSEAWATPRWLAFGISGLGLLACLGTIALLWIDGPPTQ